MKIDTAQFRIGEGEEVDLGERATRVDPPYANKDEYQAVLNRQIERLSHLQEVLYASQSHALLVVLQGMDTAGKDGVIEHVMSGVNPQGCQVHSFKKPSDEELHHDFLWRSARALPARGEIGIFNRSYYEEVVVVRVHPEQLAAQGIAPDSVGKKFWKGRYRAITELERHLHQSNLRIVKLFLHLSKDEQSQRLLARIDQADKNWKFQSGDIQERGLWPDYMKAYGQALGGTSTSHAPWHVVPADDKDTARLIAAEIIVETLEAMDLRYPAVDAARQRELQAFRTELTASPAKAPPSAKPRRPKT